MHYIGYLYASVSTLKLSILSLDHALANIAYETYINITRQHLYNVTDV